MLLNQPCTYRASGDVGHVIYEVIGPLMRHAGEALTTRHGGNAAKDVRSDREFRQIATLLKRIGVIWPQLFANLDRENRVYAATLAEVRDQCAANGVELPAPTASSADPLIRYRENQLDLDRAVQLLQPHAKTEWGAAAVRRLRAGLAEAAEIQGELIDGALAA
jgi:hypothetical protein